MIINKLNQKVRLPRKTKKALEKECGPSEYPTQLWMIREHVLTNFVIINSK